MRMEPIRLGRIVVTYKTGAAYFVIFQRFILLLSHIQRSKLRYKTAIFCEASYAFGNHGFINRRTPGL